MDEFIRALAKALCAEMATQTRETARREWVDQTNSPLKRGHNAAVRRRIERGEPGALKVGRSHLLSPEALAEEVARRGKLRLAKTEPAPDEQDVQRAAYERTMRRYGGSR